LSDKRAMVTGNKQAQQLKDLIARGKEQGYLTYTEVNDHLPNDIVDPEQIEDIVNMINDMGIAVHEKAPDFFDLQHYRCLQSAKTEIEAWAFQHGARECVRLWIAVFRQRRERRPARVIETEEFRCFIKSLADRIIESAAKHVVNP